MAFLPLSALLCDVSMSQMVLENEKSHSEAKKKRKKKLHYRTTQFIFVCLTEKVHFFDFRQAVWEKSNDLSTGCLCVIAAIVVRGL